jgi:hypothetical protein
MTDPDAQPTGKPGPRSFALRPAQAAGEPGPPGFAQWPARAAGHPRVDAALAELDRIAALPPAEQIEGFTAVHRELQETLADIDGAAGGSLPGGAGS